MLSHVTLAVPPAPGVDAPPPTRRSLGTRLAAWLPVVFGGAFLFQAVRAGLPASSAGRALLTVLVTQLLPGILIWRCVRPRHGWWLEDVALGFAVGTAVAVAAQTLAGATRTPAIAGGLGLGVTAVLLAVPGTRRRILQAGTAPLPVWWAPAVCLTSLVGVQQLRAYYRLVPLTWPAGFRAPHVDTYFHLSMAAELARRGPEHFPWVASEPLGYHWFSHAWVAQVSVVSGAGLDQVLIRFTPALMPLMLAFTVAVAAIRLSGRRWTGPVAALLTVAGGDLNVFGKATPGYPITPLSPSLALSVPALIAVVVILGLHWRGQLARGGLLMLPVLTLVATGAKGSTAPILVAGLALAAVAMAAVDRAQLRLVLLDLGLVLGALIVAVVLIFRGSEAGLHVGPRDAIRGTPAAAWLGGVHGAGTYAVVAVVTFIGVLSRGVGLGALLGSRAGRRDPLSWLLGGAGLAGAAAVVALAHPGASQWYFARSAGPLLALGTTFGLIALVDRLRIGWRFAVLVGVIAGSVLAWLPQQVFGTLNPAGGLPRVAALSGLALVVLLLAAAAMAVAPAARAHRALGVSVAGALVVTVCAAGVIEVVASQITTKLPPNAPAVSASAPLAVSRDQINAARWIRDHSKVDDLVMTNRHCVTPTPPRHCDSRRYVVAAYSERQMLLEGWSGSARATAIAPKGRESIFVDYWNPDLLRLNDGFIEHPDGTAMRRLQALGVRWVFVDHTRPYAATLAPWAIPRYRNHGVDVYEIPPAR